MLARGGATREVQRREGVDVLHAGDAEGEKAVFRVKIHCQTDLAVCILSPVTPLTGEIC
jgi:hypothetical protein